MSAAVLVATKQDIVTSSSKNTVVAFNATANALDNSGVQDIFSIDVEGLAFVAIKIAVTGAALTAFQIKAAFCGEDALTVLRSITTDFTTPKGVLVDASGDLTLQGVGTGWFILKCSGISVLVLSANTATAASIALSGGGSLI